MKNILIASVLILLGILSRTIFHTLPNLEFVTSISIIGGYIFGNRSKLTYAIPLIVMLTTDLIIGNQMIYLFTWSAFLVMPLIGIAIRKLENIFPGVVKSLVIAEGAGLVATLAFFLWTNLGVVMVTDMYTKDIPGLIHSYINALPFLRIQLSGNVIFVPMLILAYKLLGKLNKIDFLQGKLIVKQ